MFFLVVAAAVTAFNAIYHKKVMKGQIKILFSSVVIKQAKEGLLPIDSIKVNLEKLKDIDSSGFSGDMEVMDVIINSYKIDNKKDTLK